MTFNQQTISRRSVLAGLAAIPAAGFVTTAFGPAVAQAQGGERVVTLVVANEAPMLLSFVNTSSTGLSAKTTEGLLEFDADLNPHPLLAKEWSVSEDGLTYTFRLREGVKWHDGKDFTSADVVFSFETSKKLHSRNRATFAQITAFEAPDAHTVILRLQKPTSYLLRALSSVESPIVPKHLYKEGDNPLTHANNTAPVGTGPYVFKEWARGSHIIFERNPNYWDTRFPQVDRIVVRVVPDASARAIALETGEVDYGTRTPVPRRDLARLEALPNLNFETGGYSYNPPGIVILEANLGDPLLKELKVRQAIAHLIDREALVKVVYFNRAKPSASPIVPLHKEFHLADPSPYAYNIAAAEALLDEAGLPRRADGTRLKLTVDFYGDQQLAAEFLRAAFARAGVTIELRGQDLGTLIKRVYTDRDYQLHLAAVSNLFDPQVGVQRLYWSKSIAKGIPFSNGTGYSNPEVDRLLETAAVSSNHAERIELWKEIQRIVAREVPSFPLLAPDWITISNKRIAGLTTNAEGPDDGSLRELRIV